MYTFTFTFIQKRFAKRVVTTVHVVDNTRKVTIAFGITMKHPDDLDSISIAREMAIRAALKKHKISYTRRTVIWNNYFAQHPKDKR